MDLAHRIRNILICLAVSCGWPWKKKIKTSVSESCSNIKGNSLFIQTLGLSSAAFPSMPMNGEV